MINKQDVVILERLLRGGQFDIAVKLYRGVMDCDRQTAEDFLRKMCAELNVRLRPKREWKD
jgi:hypothetical protein